MRVMRLRTPFSETATVRFRYRSAGRGGEFAIATVSRVTVVGWRTVLFADGWDELVWDHIHKLG